MVFLLYVFVAIYFLAMLSILFYTLVQANLLFTFLITNKRRFEGKARKDIIWPYVTIQLPVYNEKYVAERLIHNIALMDYPPDKLEIQVLDDSTDATSVIISRTIKEYPEVDFKHIQRTIRTSYKAGALKEGLTKAKGDFIAVFDADFLPAPDFLRATIPAFEDAAIGMVQTRWTHTNENYSLLTKLQAFALDAHFLVEQVGRNAQQAFINFNGTAGVWRKNCILDAGNWNDDTLTEDLDLSYRAQQKNWKFVYLPHVEAPAELPPVMSALKSQQYRWTKGGAECAKKHLRNVIFSNLPLKTKIHAFAHLLNSSVFILVLAVTFASIPMWLGSFYSVLPMQVMNWAGIFLLSFVIISLVYIVANTYGKNHNRQNWFTNFGRSLMRLPLFLAVSLGLSLHNSVAVWEGFTGRKTPFVRTPKFNLERNRDSWKDNLYLSKKVPVITWIEAGLALLFIGLVVLSVMFNNYVLLPFHLVLAIGYSMVAISSIKSYALKQRL